MPFHRLAVNKKESFIASRSERERERKEERAEREIDVEHQPLIFSYAASCNGTV
jgi:hypothetical protein